MKVRSRAVVVAALCMSCVQVAQPKKVSVKLYKTDPTTWNKPFYYVVQTAETSVSQSAGLPPRKDGKLRMLQTSINRTPARTVTTSHSLAAYKPIKKDVTILFDDKDENVLFINSKQDGTGEDGSLVLSDPDGKHVGKTAYTTGHVIAVDNDYIPKNMFKSEVDRIIKERQNKFFKIPVYKEDPTTWGEKWTVTLVDDQKREYPDAKVVIFKDSTFKKLWIQKDIAGADYGRTYVQVRKPNGLYLVETELTDSPVTDPNRQLLVIDGRGNAAIKDKSVLENAPKNPKAKKPVPSVDYYNVEMN